MHPVYDIYKRLEESNVLLSFKGMVTTELLTTILQIMESKLDHIEEKTKTKKKVFNILVECLQNLYHHIDTDGEHKEDLNGEAQTALLMIAKTPTHYMITTGNYMEKDNVQPLKEQLDLVNSMDKGELKTFYKKVLNEGNFSDKGTAGLGMIDIARKSGEKLDYNFLDIKDKTTFFSLAVSVPEITNN